jgi:hypothetical protein
VGHRQHPAGGDPSAALAWVRAYLEALLAGQLDSVITALEAEGEGPDMHGDATAGGAADGRLLSS